MHSLHEQFKVEVRFDLLRSKSKKKYWMVLRDNTIISA